MRKGNLFVISGPSGAGKGTLVARLSRSVPDIWVSRSATTRKPRTGEVNGVQYDFLTEGQFENLIEEDGLLEWARYADHYYGTPKAHINEQLQAGKQIILEIDVQGALQVREKMPNAHLIFIEPPSMEVLKQRLVGRGTESDEVVEQRLQAAQVELNNKVKYDICIVNDDLNEATQELVNYINLFADDSK